MKKINSYFLVFVMILGGHFTSNAQSAAGDESQLEKYIREMKNQLPLTVEPSVLVKGDPQSLLSSLQTFRSDQNPHVRFAIQNLEFRLAKKHSDLTIRREVASRFVSDLAHPDPFIWQQAAKKLLHFSAENFDVGAQNQLSQLLAQEPPYREVIRIVAVAGMTRETTRLNEIVSSLEGKEDTSFGRWYGKTSWVAHLALARLGNHSEINFCIQKINAEPDEQLRVTTLLPELAFIRSTLAVEEMKRYLLSEGRLSPLFEDELGARYAQYSLEQLTTIIVDFPIEQKGIGYTDSEIEQAILWFQQNPNYEIEK